MGKNLGEVYYLLWQEMSFLYLKWDENVVLFGTKESRIKLLNQAAPLFFRLVQDTFLEDTILGIARMTDPPSSSGKPNLTIQRLPELVDTELKDKLSKLVEDAREKSEFCRDWRNRRIAHRDLDLASGRSATPLKESSRKKIDDALQTITTVLNAVEGHYSGSEVHFTHPSRIGGGELLLHVLYYGIKAEVERTKRLERGEFDDREFEVHDI